MTHANHLPELIDAEGRYKSAFSYHPFDVEVDRADGIYLYDTKGRRYIDASGGAAVSCLGHGHPVVAEAMKAQIDRLAFAYGQFFASEAGEELAEMLIADAPAGLSHVYYVSGGSEGIEAALKMARQYFVETGEPQRRHFIARRFAHGVLPERKVVVPHAQRRFCQLERIAHQLAGQFCEGLADAKLVLHLFAALARGGQTGFDQVFAAQRNLREYTGDVFGALCSCGSGFFFSHVAQARTKRRPAQA